MSQFGSIAQRVAVIASLVGLLVIMTPARSYACSCAPVGSPSEERVESTAVFSGRVLSRYIVSSDGVPAYRHTFNVTTVWKGPVDETIDVMTPRAPLVGYLST